MSDWQTLMDNRAACQRLTESRDQISTLTREMQTRLRAARVATNSDLTAEGLAKHRADLADQIRREYTPRLDQLRARVSLDAGTVRSWVTKARPQLPDDAAGLMRAQMRWDQVRMKLEAGISLPVVLAGADGETLVAIREWAPAWLQATTAGGGRIESDGSYSAPDLSGVMRRIDDRLAETHGGQVSEAIEAARTAEVTEAAATPLFAHAANVLAAGVGQEPNGLGAALAASLAESAAARPLEVDEPAAAS